MRVPPSSKTLDGLVTKMEETQRTLAQVKKERDAIQRKYAEAEFHGAVPFTKYVLTAFKLGQWTFKRGQHVRYYIYDDQGIIKGRKLGRILGLASETLFRHGQPMFLIEPVKGGLVHYLTAQQFNPDFSQVSGVHFGR